MRAVSLVVTQLDITKDWVREVLGDLAADDENPAVLRETCPCSSKPVKTRFAQQNY